MDATPPMETRPPSLEFELECDVTAGVVLLSVAAWATPMAVRVAPVAITAAAAMRVTRSRVLALALLMLSSTPS